MVESNPNTAIMLVTGNRYIVKETPDEVVEKTVEYRRKCGGTFPPPGSNGTSFERARLDA